MKYAVENGMINLSYVKDQIEMKKKEEILAKHPYSIWLGKDGNYHTYLPPKDEGGTRKLIKRKKEEDVKNIVIKYWSEKAENPTIKEVFYSWINDKLKYNEIEKSTYDRYETDFIRFFMNDKSNNKKFGNRRVKSIAQEELEVFIKETISEQKLTVKSFSNFRILIYGIFKKCKKMINFSITQLVGDLEISRKSFRKEIKEDDQEVFTEEEYPVIIQYLIANQDILNLGILLLFSTGLRIGELSTLKWGDIDGESIKIRRTETIYKDEKRKKMFSVREFPKTKAGVREVVLPQNNLWILKKIRSINPFGNFVFENNGERIRSLIFRRRLYNICNELNITKKSPHKIRKTYGSILLNCGIDKRFIISQMGHTDIACTEQHYHRDRRNKARKSEILDNIPELRMTKA